MYIFSKGETLYGYVHFRRNRSHALMAINISKILETKAKIALPVSATDGATKKSAKRVQHRFRVFVGFIITKTIAILIFLFPSLFSSSWLLIFASSITSQDNFLVTCVAWRFCRVHLGAKPQQRSRFRERVAELLSPQSSRSFTAPPGLFGRWTKTAMLRGLISLKKPTILWKTLDKNDVRRYPYKD